MGDESCSKLLLGIGRGGTFSIPDSIIEPAEKKIGR